MEPGVTPPIEDDTSPIITIEPDANPVQLSIGASWTLPLATAIDDVDGELENIEIDASQIALYYNEINDEYIFTLEGTYEVIYTVSDLSGNEAILVLFIEISVSGSYTGYYESIDGLSGTALVDALYDLLNDTGTFSTTTYGEARYILEESDIWIDFNEDYMYLIYTDTLRTPAGDGFQFDGYGLPTWDANSDGTNTTWNREHVWAKSLFGNGNYDPDAGTRGIDADMHNLRAADTNVNSSRGNNIFINQVYHAEGFGNYSSQWYPGDNHRGDVARILFYMDIRWGEMTNLSLIGDLATLIAWHEADPVDDFEIHRNNIIYGYQNNRNPFIDHPELVYEIYN